MVVRRGPRGRQPEGFSIMYAYGGYECPASPGPLPLFEDDDDVIDVATTTTTTTTTPTQTTALALALDTPFARAPQGDDTLMTLVNATAACEVDSDEEFEKVLSEGLNTMSSSDGSNTSTNTSPNRTSLYQMKSLSRSFDKVKVTEPSTLLIGGRNSNSGGIGAPSVAALQRAERSLKRGNQVCNAAFLSYMCEIMEHDLKFTGRERHCSLYIGNLLTKKSVVNKSNRARIAAAITMLINMTRKSRVRLPRDRFLMAFGVSDKDLNRGRKRLIKSLPDDEMVRDALYKEHGDETSIMDALDERASSLPAGFLKSRQHRIPLRNVCEDVITHLHSMGADRRKKVDLFGRCVFIMCWELLHKDEPTRSNLRSSLLSYLDVKVSTYDKNSKFIKEHLSSFPGGYDGFCEHAVMRTNTSIAAQSRGFMGVKA